MSWFFFLQSLDSWPQAPWVQQYLSTWFQIKVDFGFVFVGGGCCGEIIWDCNCRMSWSKSWLVMELAAGVKVEVGDGVKEFIFWLEECDEIWFTESLISVLKSEILAFNSWMTLFAWWNGVLWIVLPRIFFKALQAWLKWSLKFLHDCCAAGSSNQSVNPFSKSPRLLDDIKTQINKLFVDFWNFCCCR